MNKDRLLVIDDEPDFVSFVEKVAVECGYEVRPLIDSTALLPVLESWLPTFILLDLKMPRIDGFEVLKILARDHRVAKITICSGAEPHIARAALRLGKMMGLEVVGLLPKPVRAAELRDHLGAARVASMASSVGQGLDQVS